MVIDLILDNSNRNACGILVYVTNSCTQWTHLQTPHETIDSSHGVYHHHIMKTSALLVEATWDKNPWIGP